MNSFQSSRTRNGAWLGCDRISATALGASNARVCPRIVLVAVSARLGVNVTTGGVVAKLSWYPVNARARLCTSLWL